MPEDDNGHAYIDGVPKEECFERWEGVNWKPSKNDPKVGRCKSNYDFDNWIAEYESKKEETDGNEKD